MFDQKTKKKKKKKNHFLANLAHQSWYPFEQLSFKDKIQFNLLLGKKKTIFVLILYGYFYFVHIFSNFLFWFMSFQLNFILVLIISLWWKLLMCHLIKKNYLNNIKNTTSGLNLLKNKSHISIKNIYIFFF